MNWPTSTTSTPDPCASALDERLEECHESPLEAFGGLPRMVNRNDGAVDAVLVGGQTVVRDGVPTDAVGRDRTVHFLRAGQRTRAARPARAVADVV